MLRKAKKKYTAHNNEMINELFVHKLHFQFSLKKTAQRLQILERNDSYGNKESCFCFVMQMK